MEREREREMREGNERERERDGRKVEHRTQSFIHSFTLTKFFPIQTSLPLSLSLSLTRKVGVKHENEQVLDHHLESQSSRMKDEE